MISLWKFTTVISLILFTNSYRLFFQLFLKLPKWHYHSSFLQPSVFFTKSFYFVKNYFVISTDKKNYPMQIDMLKNITRYRNFIFMLWKMNFHEVEWHFDSWTWSLSTPTLRFLWMRGRKIEIWKSQIWKIKIKYWKTKEKGRFFCSTFQLFQKKRPLR